MPETYQIRSAINFGTIYFPLLVIAISFIDPKLKHARFVLYPLWYMLYIPFGFSLGPVLQRLFPSGRVVSLSDPIGFIDYYALGINLLALVLAYSALTFHLRRPCTGVKSRRIDDVLIFLALASLAFTTAFPNFRSFSQPLFTQAFDNVVWMATNILPIVFLAVAWRAFGHLAPAASGAGAISGLMLSRALVILGIVLKISSLFPLLLFMIAFSIGAVGLAGFMNAYYESIGGSVCILIGLALYEWARYRNSQRA